MIMGYFDESADSHAEFVCMSGYIAEDGDWEALTDDWNKLCRKHRIPYFHTTDFIGSNGVYEELGWKNSELNDLIPQVLDEFISVIRKHKITGIGVGLAGRHFREITRTVAKREKPEVFCFERVLRLVVERLDKWGWHEPVCMIFDDSEAYSMKAYANLCEIKDRNPDLRKRVAGIAFGDDEFFAPLQAADLLAYATTRMNSSGDGAWLYHPQFKNLLKDENPAYGKLYDSENWDVAELDRRKEELLQVGNRLYVGKTGRNKAK